MHTSSALYQPLMSTPQNMLSSLGSWINRQHGATFEPAENENFFAHQLQANRGEVSFVLFYFK